MLHSCSYVRNVGTFVTELVLKPNHNVFLNLNKKLWHLGDDGPVRSGPIRVSLLHCSGHVVSCDGDGDVRKEIIQNLI